MGSPTVILIAGYGNRGSAWSVLPPGFRHRRSCREFPASPGSAPTTGRGPSASRMTRPSGAAATPCPSPAPPRTRSVTLHALLQAARVPGPYVLTAHSLGGLYARLFTATHPDEVVGMVLIDAAHERYNAELRRLLTPRSSPR